MTTPQDSPINVQEYLNRGDAYGWFDALYAQTADGGTPPPWSQMAPRPAFVHWLRMQPQASGQRALVVACGLGDDAEALAEHGYTVTAFDVSPKAIQLCQERFPQSPVAYHVADMFAPPSHWVGGFDFVLEIFTIQALPIEMRTKAVAAVCQFVAPGGTLLNICLGTGQSEGRTGPPWPFTLAEIDLFTQHGLTQTRFDVARSHDQDVSGLWRVEYQRPVH